MTAVLYYRWLAAGLYDKIISQGVGGHRVYVGIRHPLQLASFVAPRSFPQISKLVLGTYSDQHYLICKMSKQKGIYLSNVFWKYGVQRQLYSPISQHKSAKRIFKKSSYIMFYFPAKC